MNAKRIEMPRLVWVLLPLLLIGCTEGGTENAGIHATPDVPPPVQARASWLPARARREAGAASAPVRSLSSKPEAPMEWTR